MKHRHIHAKRGEWIHVHRDKDPGCLGVLIVIVVLIAIVSGC